MHLRPALRSLFTNFGETAIVLQIPTDCYVRQFFILQNSKYNAHITIEFIQSFNSSILRLRGVTNNRTPLHLPLLNLCNVENRLTQPCANIASAGSHQNYFIFGFICHADATRIKHLNDSDMLVERDCDRLQKSNKRFLKIPVVFIRT